MNVRQRVIISAHHLCNVVGCRCECVLMTNGSKNTDSQVQRRLYSTAGIFLPHCFGDPHQHSPPADHTELATTVLLSFIAMTL